MLNRSILLVLKGTNDFRRKQSLDAKSNSKKCESLNFIVIAFLRIKGRVYSRKLAKPMKYYLCIVN